MHRLYPCGALLNSARLGYLPTLRFLQFSHDHIRHPTISDLSSPCNHLTSSHLRMYIDLTAQSARALTQLPNLQHLDPMLSRSSYRAGPVTLSLCHLAASSYSAYFDSFVPAVVAIPRPDEPSNSSHHCTNPSNSPAYQDVDALAAHMATRHPSCTCF